MARMIWIAAATAGALIAAGAAAQDFAAVSIVSAGPCASDTNPVGSGPGAPFGYFDGHPDAAIHGVSGLLALTGWALDDSGVARVEILVDDRTIAAAEYGQNRPGIDQLYPGFPNAGNAEFGYQLDTSHFLNGVHEVSAAVVSNTGERERLNTHLFLFTNTSHALVPFGGIEFPNDGAELAGNCNVLSPSRRYSVIYGWALDAGVETNDHGVGWVELLIDGSIYASTRRDCIHHPIAGAFTNCYGIRRLDVQEIYEPLKDASHAGFRFVLDIGVLIDFGYTPGHHVLTVRANDLDSQLANIDSMHVTFQCDDFFQNEASFGAIDPAPGANDGQIQVTGWALDREAVSRVDISIDGVFRGSAAYGLPLAGITSLYPGFPNTALPGWVFTVDTTVLSNGDHVLFANVVDNTKSVVGIGEMRFNVSNP